ncbi:hypothetical protein MRY87_06300 [bacterium]|nr:hypothetical protein [bacterium]
MNKLFGWSATYHLESDGERERFRWSFDKMMKIHERARTAATSEGRFSGIAAVTVLALSLPSAAAGGEESKLDGLRCGNSLVQSLDRDSLEEIRRRVLAHPTFSRFYRDLNGDSSHLAQPFSKERCNTVLRTGNRDDALRFERLLYLEMKALLTNSPDAVMEQWDEERCEEAFQLRIDALGLLASHMNAHSYDPRAALHLELLSDAFVDLSAMVQAFGRVAPSSDDDILGRSRGDRERALTRGLSYLPFAGAIERLPEDRRDDATRMLRSMVLDAAVQCEGVEDRDPLSSEAAQELAAAFRIILQGHDLAGREEMLVLSCVPAAEKMASLVDEELAPEFIHFTGQSFETLVALQHALMQREGGAAAPIAAEIPNFLRRILEASESSAPVCSEALSALVKIGGGDRKVLQRQIYSIFERLVSEEIPGNVHQVMKLARVCINSLSLEGVGERSREYLESSRQRLLEILARAEDFPLKERIQQHIGRRFPPLSQERRKR